MMPEDERKAYDGYLAYLGQELDILESAKEEAMIDVAKEMLKEGDSIEKISRVTKLPIVTIQKLAKETISLSGAPVGFKYGQLSSHVV